MVNFLMVVIFPVFVGMGMFFSWQAKKKKVERQKFRTEMKTITGFQPEKHFETDRRPLLIRVPKIAE